MTCPACQTANPAGAKFCFHCGAPLALKCSHCGATLPAGAKFCMNCGTRVGDAPAGQPAPAALPPPAAPGSRLDQFIPKELLAKLKSAQNAGMEGERRVVTMLFCDVKGSTAAASQLDPEEWAELINGAFTHMIQPVYRYEGTVARLMGDGLLAFFGAPIAHEDDPQRAILAGLDIVEAIKRHRPQVRQRWGVELDVRVGINTGLVVVGAVGSDLRMEYTALGDAINLAARMEQTAQPGTVQVAEATHRLVAPLFDMEVLHDLEVKGRTEPVTAYRVLGRRTLPGRLGVVRGVAGLRSPLVARDDELASLIAAGRALSSGRGQIISVMGEAGLGKSRLVAELRDALAAAQDQAVQWIEGRSLSYETSTPYAPFVDMLAAGFSVEPASRALGANDAQRYGNILARIEALFPGRGAEMAPFFATLLGVEPPADHAERVKYLDPPTLRGLTFGHVTAYFERLAAQRPLVLFFDDVHWIDPTSLDLLQSLLPLTLAAPILILVAFRPRRQEPSWRFHEAVQRDPSCRYTALALQPLDQSQSRALVANLLHVEDLPEKVRQLIMEKAEGNPFFVEEVIRSLLDAQLVVRDNGHWRATREIINLTVPDTLNGVITARLDRLDETTRHLAQAAAVLGREFPHDVLAELFDAPDALDDGILELQRRDLVQEKSRLPRRIYAFKHVLTQEAAYQSSLLSKRRDLHRRAAQALARLQLPDQAAEIARHFLEARQPAAAMPYLVQAGDRAARSYATTEAIGFFTRALDVQAAVAETDLIGRAYEGLGGALAFANQFPEAVETYRTMLAWAERQGAVAMQVSALNKLAGVYALRLGQFPEAEQFLARAERLAHEYDEPSGMAEGAVIRCQMCTAKADFDAVVAHMQEVVAIGERLGSREHRVTGLEHVASSLAFLTRFDEAWEKGQLALQLAREIGDREHEAWVLCTTFPICLLRDGLFDSAREHVTQGVEIAERIHSSGALIYGNWVLAEIARWQGEYEQALLYGQRSLEAALPLEPFMPFMTVQPLGSLGSTYLEISPHFSDQISQFHLHALRLLENPVGMGGGGTAWADVGFCAMTLGDLDIAEASFQKGLNVPTMFMRLERARHLAGLALVTLRRGRADEALRLAQEARAYAEERRMRHLYPLVALCTARIHADRGEREPALLEYQRAETQALKLEMLPFAWQAQAGAAQVLSEMGCHAEAHQKRDAGRALVDQIAGRFQDAALRAGFLTSARVRLAAP